MNLNQIATLSGNLLSGQVGNTHLASGSVRSGTLATTGTPDGTKFLRDDFSWATAGGGLSSGAVGSGYLASGSVQGFFGATRNIASGTLGVFDLGSGAITAGTVGSGAIVSGNLASGQIGTFHVALAAITAPQMASGSVLSGNVASGQIGNSHLAANTVRSGHVGSGAVIGQAGGGNFNIASGTITTNDLGSGSIVSGLIASGQIGSLHIASGRLTGFELGSGTIVSGRVASGQIGFGHLANASVQSGTVASGQINTDHLASGALITRAQELMLWDASGGTVRMFSEEAISGIRAVQVSQSGNLRIAMASVSGRMPAIGVVTTNGVSGAPLNVRLFGPLVLTVSGVIDTSGYLGSPLYVGRSGQLVTQSGAFNSGGFLSGDVLQQVAVATASGQVTLTVYDPYVSGGPAVLVSGSAGSGVIASGAVQGFFGTTRNIASGTVGVFDFGSGAVVAGSVGSGAVVSGNVASGQIGNGHLANAAVQSGAIQSGVVFPFHMRSGTIFAGDGIGVTIAASGITITNLSGTGGAAGNLSGTVHNLTTIYSGGGLISEEPISGVRAVAISRSGNLRIAMAAVSGRMPAVGFVIDNVASGIAAQVFTDGVFSFASGLVNFSGLDTTIVVGRSGHLVVTSGWFNSGGFLSGDTLQILGYGINSGVGAFSLNLTTAQRASG